jgi:hypothetical protein
VAALKGHALDEKTKLCECGHDVGPTRDGARVKHREHKEKLANLDLLVAIGDAVVEGQKSYEIEVTEADIAQCIERLPAAMDSAVAKLTRPARIQEALATPMRQRTPMHAALASLGRLVSQGTFK